MLRNPLNAPQSQELHFQDLRNPAAIEKQYFAILWIVYRLHLQCNPETIWMDCNQMSSIGPGLLCHPNQTGISPRFHNQPKDLEMPILTAVDNVKLNCDGIAKLRRIARRSKELHQNRGKAPNCSQGSEHSPPKTRAQSLAIMSIAG